MLELKTALSSSKQYLLCQVKSAGENCLLVTSIFFIGLKTGEVLGQKTFIDGNKISNQDQFFCIESVVYQEHILYHRPVFCVYVVGSAVV